MKRRPDVQRGRTHSDSEAGASDGHRRTPIEDADSFHGELAAASAVAWTADFDSGELRFSESAGQVLGLRKRLDVRTALDGLVLIHPGDRERILHAWELARDGIFSDIAFRFVRPDNRRTLWLEARGVPIRDKANRTTGLKGLLLDITAGREALDLLRTSEASVRQILDILPIYVAVRNAAGRFLLANQQMAGAFGRTPLEVEGMTYADMQCITPESLDSIASDKEVIDNEIVKVISGETLTLSNGNTQALHTIKVPFRLTDGEPAVLAVSLDITERLRAEEALRLSEARYRTQIEHAPEAILIFDVDRERIIEANGNAEQLFGLSRRMLYERAVHTLSPEFQPDGLTSAGKSAEFTQRAMDGESPVFEWVYLGDGRQHLPCEVRLVRLPAPNAERLLRFSIVDITERKRLAELRQTSADMEERSRRVEEASRLKSEFLANMSHELRTPLNAIIGFAELMHDGHVDPRSPLQKEFLGDILSSGKHLLQLINDVLDLAKVEAGKILLRPEPVDVHRLVSEVSASLRTTAAARRIELRVEVGAPKERVLLDPGRFKQVLYNYLSNAIKFTHDDGVVTIRTIPAGDDQFRLEVEDNGVGIRKEDLGKLFVEFQQLEHGANGNQCGSGLGLALTKRLVDAQGGSVGVRSTFGVGSTFHAVFPRLPVYETAKGNLI